MKKAIVIVLAFMMLAMGAGTGLALANPNPTVTVYANDRPGWESAVGVYEEEFFTDATLNPGVSVVSTYPGYVDTAKGVWWDRLVCPYYGLTTTTWQFDTPVLGFGGYWDPGVPGGPGAAIAAAINGSWVTIGEIPQTYTGQFWGFVSTVPFSAVRLSPGSNCNGAWCETYEMDNMVYSRLVEVDIDIKPMSDPNSINLKSKGIIPVAILTTPAFDATTVDGTSVVFAGASPAHDLSDPAVVADHQHDVDLDGDIDYVFHFRVEDTDILPGDTEACLKGTALGAMHIHGCDSVRTVGK